MKTSQWIFLHYSLLLLLTGLCGSVAAQNNPILNEAKQRYEEKKYRESLVLLERALTSEGGSAELHHFRGKCYMDLSQTDSAISAYYTGLSLDKNYANSYYNLGLCYYDKSSYRQALSTFQLYCQLKPEDPDGWMQQGVSYDYMNQVDSSRYFFDKSLQINPLHWETFYYRARLNTRLNNFKEAMADINQAIEINAATMQLYLLRGYLREESQDLEGAIGDYTSAINIDREDIYALSARASAYLTLQKYDESISDAQAILTKKPTSNKAMHLLAYNHYLKEDFARSVKYAEKGKEIAPQEPVFCTLAGLSYLYLKKYDKSIENFDMAIAKDPSSTENYRFKVDAMLLKNTEIAKLTQDKPSRLNNVYADNIGRMDQAATDPKSEYHFAKLLKKFQKDYTSLGLDEYFMLYYGQSAQENYNPYATSLDDFVQDMRDKLEQGDYLSCARQGTALLKQNPLATDVYFYTAIAYYNMDQYAEYEEYITKYRCFMKSILATGDGKTFETAYLVISPKDEYSLLYFLGYAAEDQSLVVGEGHTCDLLDATNEHGEKKKFFFNVDKPFQSLGSMIQEDKNARERKKGIKKS